MSNRTRELRRGLAAVAPFLLSHHLPEEHDRCYRVAVGDRAVHLCARCLGIYPGIAVGVWFGLAGSGVSLGLASVDILDGWLPTTTVFGGSLSATTALALTAVLPAPALLDWARTTFGDADGTNPVRTVTGFALGVGYGLGLTALLRGDLRVVAVGLTYGVVAGVLLWRATAD